MLRGLDCGRDHAVDLHAVAKCWPDRFTGLNGLEEVPRLDDDLILVAGSMPCALAEGQGVGMRGARQDLRKPARGFRPLDAIKPNGVLIFLIEAQGALRAVHLVGVAHFASSRDAAEVALSHDAAR